LLFGAALRGRAAGQAANGRTEDVGSTGWVISVALCTPRMTHLARWLAAVRRTRFRGPAGALVAP
jgi:hypothetical protein